MGTCVYVCIYCFLHVNVYEHLCYILYGVKSNKNIKKYLSIYLSVCLSTYSSFCKFVSKLAREKYIKILTLKKYAAKQ